MCCLKCKSENLHHSTTLIIEERRGPLSDVSHFMLCRDCGYVMMRTMDDELIGTDLITDKSVIELAYAKLFNSSSFNGTKPTQYGFSSQGKKLPTSGFNHRPSAKDQSAVSEAPAVDNELEETYPHVSNYEERQAEPSSTGLFGKIFRTIRNLFTKAS